jgi:hypothetical protein
VGDLLYSLREAGAGQQATALAGRPPGPGMFKLFLEQLDRADQFRFGRQADGNSSMPWGWEDADLWPAPAPRKKQANAGAGPARVSVRGSLNGHLPAWRRKTVTV